MNPLHSAAAAPLTGEISVPGDKSISHRALIFGALAVGESRAAGLLEGEDVLRTAAALRAMGALIDRRAGLDGQPVWHIQGVGVGGLAEPDGVLDMGNAGTGARLLMGLVASHDFTSFFTGDASLRRRPMARVTVPLSQMGSRFITRDGGRLPIAVVGAANPMPIEYTLPVASAQVKSAILLAGLNTPGETCVIEPEATRDHTENLLRHFGATVRVEPAARGRRIVVVGQPELRPQNIVVPGDPSSAAFAAVAAAIVPGADIVIRNVGINPLRTGLFDTLAEMGARMEWQNRRDEGGEPVADLHIRHSALKGITVPPARAPTMIDEYPILMIAAAFATGDTVIRGAKEMRVKESDRIAVMARGLIAAGISIEELDDGMIVKGNGRPPAGGAKIVTDMDHRIVMSFLVLGMASKAGIDIDDAEMIDTSFPGFAGLMNGLGAKIATPEV